MGLTPSLAVHVASGSFGVEKTGRQSRMEWAARRFDAEEARRVRAFVEARMRGEAVILPGEERLRPGLCLKRIWEGGIYTALAVVNPGEAGTLYLKAKEITRDWPLSESQLAMKSSVPACFDSDPKILCIQMIPRFTIFEGDWDEFYAARFELWFRPDDTSKPERCLMRENFRIDGWMR